MKKQKKKIESICCYEEKGSCEPCEEEFSQIKENEEEN